MHLMIADGNTYTTGKKRGRGEQSNPLTLVMPRFCNLFHKFIIHLKRFILIPAKTFPWSQIAGIIHVKILSIYFALGKERRRELCIEI